MFIQKIELENFTCYAGKNSFEFDKGINVIVGDNGYGKSQLFDAFYWVIYNRIFMSKELKNFKEVKTNIISDKAKIESQDGPISTSVKITLLDYRSKDIYVLERKYNALKKGSEVIGEPDSELIIIRKKMPHIISTLITDSAEKNSILARILPPNKTEYLWFQGEQVDKIIDFQQQDSLKKAIDVLSNIDIYDKIERLIITLSKTSEEEYNRELRKVSRDRSKSNELESQKERAENRIKELKENENDLRNQITEAEERNNNLINKLEDAQNIKSLQNKKMLLQESLKELQETYNKENSLFYKKMFRNKWVIKGSEELAAEYNKIYECYEKEKSYLERKLELEKIKEKENLSIIQARLPLDVPEPIYINRMLEQERCLVCDREARRDSAPWNKMKELLDRKPLKIITDSNIDQRKQDFGLEFKSLYNQGLIFSHKIQDIDEDIKSSIGTLLELENKIKKKMKELEEKEEQISDLVGKTFINIDTANNIYNEYYINHDIYKKKSEELSIVIQQLNQYEGILKNVNCELESLATGEIPKSLKMKRDILLDLEKISTNTKKRVFENLVNKLENQANEHYLEMTANNEAVTGKIKLIPQKNGNFIPAVTDSNGVPLHGLNTSNLTLVKLSVIMAIISANYQECGGSLDEGIDLYTFITDAPTSVFGDAYTIGFCKTVSKVYNQSIIMSKEFYRNEKLMNELLTNSEIKLGNVYKITPSIPTLNRIDRSNLTTKITRIK